MTSAPILHVCAQRGPGKLLRSGALAVRPCLRGVPEHIVRPTFSGGSYHISEYTIGVDVFCRGARFGQRCDAIVPAQALKLRERIAELLPRKRCRRARDDRHPGDSYSPLFRVNDPAPAALLDDPEESCLQAERLVLQATPRLLMHARHLLQQGIQQKYITDAFLTPPRRCWSRHPTM